VRKIQVVSKTLPPSTEQIIKIMNHCLQQKELIFGQFHSLSEKCNGIPGTSPVFSEERVPM